MDKTTSVLIIVAAVMIGTAIIVAAVIISQSTTDNEPTPIGRPTTTYDSGKTWTEYNACLDNKIDDLLAAGGRTHSMAKRRAEFDCAGLKPRN